MDITLLGMGKPILITDHINTEMGFSCLNMINII